MSVNKLQTILLSSLLISAMSLAAPGQSTKSAAPAQGTISNVEDVLQVQNALTDLMYEPGDVNGLMTAKTRQSIREFQYLNNIPVTGNIDQETKAAVDSQWRGGIETASVGKTYSSTVEREKPSAARQEKTAKDKSDDKSDKKESSDRISKAAAVLQDLTSAADKRIPNELLERAQAIAVIPNMIKGAFGIGGRYGKGVVAQRLDNGRWSAPAFIEIGGGSFGAQLGVSSTDLVLVFTDRKALSLLQGGKDLKLGVDAAAVAGPVGREAETGVNVKLESAIYAYSRSKGLFVGVALDGAVLDIDDSRNTKVYGASTSARDILNGTIAANQTVRPFMNALDKVTPKKSISQK